LLRLKVGDQYQVRLLADNDRAIGVYERLGFAISRPMEFYFMERGKVYASLTFANVLRR
jgi:ribosomal protein S18 acetylase RimI-like enzyme